MLQQPRASHSRCAIIGMSVESALQALRLDPRFMSNIVRWERLPARPAQTAPFPAGSTRGSSPRSPAAASPRSTAHQAAAVDSGAAGRTRRGRDAGRQRQDVLLQPPRAPAAACRPAGRALYLFPTKALAHDQLAELTRARLRGRRQRAALRPMTATRRRRSEPRSAIARASSSRTPTCCTWASCPSTRAGPRSSPPCASWSSTRCTSTAACSARTSRTSCAGCAASARSTAAGRSSSSPPPPSPTRASWPSGWSRRR